MVEARAALHMLPRTGGVYHVTRGEMDVCLLPRLAKKTGNFVVASFHESTGRLKYYLDKIRLAEQLHGAILLSECQRSYFAPRLPPERIFVVHHGVDTDFFRPAPTPPTEPVCISVGSHMRDSKTLTAAMRLVWRVNSSVQLRGIGTRTDKETAPPVVDDARIVLRDHIGDAELLREYQSSSVAVLSVWDAVANNALLEQMACGLPTIASDIGGIREYLGDDAGVLVPPEDPAALAGAILQLMADGAARARMGDAARRRALLFDQRIVAERLTDVYSRVAKLGC
jgi:glycosyltransferase involved in cell wall biosynthesis